MSPASISTCHESESGRRSPKLHKLPKLREAFANIASSEQLSKSFQSFSWAPRGCSESLEQKQWARARIIVWVFALNLTHAPSWLGFNGGSGRRLVKAQEGRLRDLLIACSCWLWTFWIIMPDTIGAWRLMTATVDLNSWSS